MKKNVLPICVALAALALSIVSFVLLPDTVVVQVGLDGSAGTTFPKWAAIAVPFAMSFGGALAVIFDKDNDKPNTKWFVVSFVGLILFCLTLIFNL